MKMYAERKELREKEAAEAAADPAKAAALSAAAKQGDEDGEDSDAEESPADGMGMMAGMQDDKSKSKEQEPLPASVLGRYAKVLMSSHEFLFVR
jgi:hypothetical protein